MTIAVLKNKFIVLFTVIFGTLSFPIATPPEQRLATAEVTRADILTKFARVQTFKHAEVAYTPEVEK